MSNLRFRYTLILMLVLLIAGVFSFAGLISANGGERDSHEGRGDDDKGEREGRYAAPPKDSAYSQECGSCHFLYFPGLLPENSWVKLMAQTDHFGEVLGLDAAVKKEITEYLKANSADKNRQTEWSSKIMRSLGSLTPVKITEVPYITRKHGKIKREVFSRPSVGTLSNCGACHKTGAQGDFEEDNVKIPR